MCLGCSEGASWSSASVWERQHLGKELQQHQFPAALLLKLSWDICSGGRGTVGRAKGLSLGKRPHRINWHELELKSK